MGESIQFGVNRYEKNLKQAMISSRFSLVVYAVSVWAERRNVCVCLKNCSQLSGTRFCEMSYTIVAFNFEQYCVWWKTTKNGGGRGLAVVWFFLATKV